MPEISTMTGADSSSGLEQEAAMMRAIERRKVQKPTSSHGKIPDIKKSGYNALDKNSFLKLLVTQLQKQDPTNPMNDKEFISQMAQFSSLEQMNNVANQMTKMRASQATALIGKMVLGKDIETDKPLQGIPTTTLYQSDGSVLLRINGRFTKLDDVTAVTEVAPTAAPIPTPTPLALPNSGGVTAVDQNVSRETAARSVSQSTAAQEYEKNQKAAEQIPQRTLSATEPAAEPPVTSTNKK